MAKKPKSLRNTFSQFPTAYSINNVSLAMVSNVKELYKICVSCFIVSQKVSSSHNCKTLNIEMCSENVLFIKSCETYKLTKKTENKWKQNKKTLRICSTSNEMVILLNYRLFVYGKIRDLDFFNERRVINWRICETNNNNFLKDIYRRSSKLYFWYIQVKVICLA